MHVAAWPVLPDSTLAPQEVLEKFRVRALAGLGNQVCDESGCYDDGMTLDTPAPIIPTAGCPGSPGCPGYVDPNTNAAIQAAIASNTVATPNTTITLPTGTVATGYTIPSQSSLAWASVAAALLKGGITLAEIQSIPPGTVVSANGAILRQATGLPVPISNTNLGLSATGSSGMLVVAAVGIALVVMMSGKR